MVRDECALWHTLKTGHRKPSINDSNGIEITRFYFALGIQVKWTASLANAFIRKTIKFVTTLLVKRGHIDARNVIQLMPIVKYRISKSILTLTALVLYSSITLFAVP